MILIFAIVCSIYVILRITLLGRESHFPRKMRIFPLQSYYNYLYNWSVYLFVQNVQNILMFFPLGFFSSVFLENREQHFRRAIVMTVAVFVSMAVEIIQYIKAIGVLETDDVIHNTLGAICGCVLYELISCIKIKEMRKGSFEIQIIDQKSVIKILKRVTIAVFVCILMYAVAYAIHWYRIDYLWYIRS